MASWFSTFIDDVEEFANDAVDTVSGIGTGIADGVGDVYDSILGIFDSGNKVGNIDTGYSTQQTGTPNPPVSFGINKNILILAGVAVVAALLLRGK